MSVSEEGPASPPVPDVELLPRLKASEEQFLAVVANIPGAVYRCACEDDWPIRYISDHIERICGYPSADFIDNAARTYGSIIHPEDRPSVADEIDRALDFGSSYSLQYRVVHAEGGARWVSERGRVILGDNGKPLWLDGVILDVTDQVLAEHDRDRAESALRRQAEFNRHQALHDSLTGLPNRVLFQDRVRQAILAAQRGGKKVSVLVMDLDRFKEINDTLGHAAGDRFLADAAKRIQGTLRGADSIARLGGDEFGILLHDSTDESVVGAAERIRMAFEEPFSLDGLPLQMEASIGVASYPAHAYDVEGLIQRADVAMYVAKTDGRGWALYDPELDRHEPQRLALISELRRAIDEHELVLHYQPKITLSSGRVDGVEALVRWHHPTRGLIGPDEFIGIAQETSLIKPFTLWVVEEALRQCREWAEEGRSLTVAVNVSTRNLIDIDFPDQVGELLVKYDIAPELLELEITETAIVADMFRMRTVLERLGQMGLRLSVDDFGTGYTSLGYLRRLPINELKIDRSFVTNMTCSDEDAVIVRSTIDLGRNLGLEVVAEGVEDPAVLERLKELGCDVAQGFLMSHPIPAAELTLWLDQLPSEVDDRGWLPGDPPPTRGLVLIGADRLRILDIVRVAADEAPAVLDPSVQSRLSAAALAGEPSSADRLTILGHCPGHGNPAPPEFVRAAMLVWAHGLAGAGSAVNLAVAETVLGALNHGAVPTVHLIGSPAQSGRSPLAEIARALSGQGPDAGIMAGAGPAPHIPAALIESDAFSVGLGALALARAGTAVRALGLSATLSHDGFTGHGGDAAEPTGLRHAPRIHTVARQAVQHAAELTEAALGALPQSPDAGAALDVALDYARLALARATTAADQRIQHHPGPAPLSAALAADSRRLAVPASLHDPLPTTAATADQITAAPTAAHRLHDLAGHAIQLATLELVAAAQTVERGQAVERLGRHAALAYGRVREFVPALADHRVRADGVALLAGWLEHEYPKSDVGPVVPSTPAGPSGPAVPPAPPGAPTTIGLPR
jgi:diguanylate cyclase (GGDEF)-like protein/PAS domain S-box-containing protein